MIQLIEENIRIAQNAYPQSLSGNELKLIEDVKITLARVMKLGCTGCGYCMPCPAGIDIPTCFNCYNSKHLFGERIYHFAYLVYTGGMDGGNPSYASLCRDCAKCEEHCPQGLPIRNHMKVVSKDMESFYFKPVVGLVRGYYKIRKLLKREKKRQ
ncbi:MAG: 4Fe-4S dicluster domain-containing protein [Bacillota bacterium]|nr:4Fe-4S dicluster domain-containing protein [Bacillota bacterium]